MNWLRNPFSRTAAEVEAANSEVVPIKKTAGVTRARFSAGEVDRLTASFLGSNLSINELLRRNLVRMRMRSRQLWMDNPYAKHFYRMLNANVIGPKGIRLQAQFMNDRGEPDPSDRQLVETNWQRWGSRRHCSIDRKLSWAALQAMVLETVARDGEVLVEKIRSPRFQLGPKLRVLEADHLDVNYNDRLSNGHLIVMSVELDPNDMPVAYHLTDMHPGDRADFSVRRRRRVPVDRMLHIFRAERPGQVRGMPWGHSALRGLNMMGKIQEAELIASLNEASKCFFYMTEDGASVANMDELGPTDPEQEVSAPDLVEEVEPGMGYELPEGVTVHEHDPQHPNSAFEAFNKMILQGVSSGWGVAYNSLANDLTGVNFSSIRSGKLEERDQWRMIQNWFAEQLHEEVYADWIEWNVAVGSLTTLPLEKLETKFMEVRWQARGWQWVDPLKDVKSSIDEYLLGTTTLTEIAQAQGKDLHDIFRERKAELDLAKKIGIEVGKVNNLSLADLLIGDDDDESKAKANS